MKKICMAILLAILFPTIVTLAWTGSVGGREKPMFSNRGKRVLLDRGNGTQVMDAEEYLLGIVARQMPADYGKEALKAQAVIARTYIFGLMSEEDEIPESALDLDYPEEKQLKELWGKEHMAKYYENLKEAVKETEGMVITYEGELITPLFHRVSAGRTRSKEEEFPYIKSVESVSDEEADGFLQIFVFTPEEFASKIREIPDSGALKTENLFSQIQVVSMDHAGYVEEIQIGSRSYTGEEIEYTLGLPSSAFVLEDYEGKVRAVVKGIGHGYGMSQWGAKEKGEEGWTAEEILAYFYPGTSITRLALERI